MIKNFRIRCTPRTAALVVSTLLAWALGVVVAIATPFWASALWGVPAIPAVAGLAAVATYRRRGHRAWGDAARIGGLAIGLLWLQVVALILVWGYTGPLELVVLAGVGGLLVWRRRRRAAARGAVGSPRRRTQHRRSSWTWGAVSMGAGLVTLVALWWVLYAIEDNVPDTALWVLVWVPGFGLGLAASGVYATSGRAAARDSILVSVAATGVVAAALTALGLADLAGDIPAIGVVLGAPFLFVYFGLIALWVVGAPAVAGACVTACGLSRCLPAGRPKSI